MTTTEAQPTPEALGTPAEGPVAIPRHLRPNDYETIYILRPDVDPDAADRIAARINEVLAKLRGKLVKVENWGKRRLAFPVARQPKGFFIYTRYLGYGDVVQEIERNLRLFDAVIKFQTVRLDRQVDPAAHEVRPEDVQFQRIEHVAEAEEPERPEDAFGLSEMPEVADLPEERAPHEAGAAPEESVEAPAKSTEAAATSTKAAATSNEAPAKSTEAAAKSTKASAKGAKGKGAKAAKSAKAAAESEESPADDGDETKDKE